MRLESFLQYLNLNRQRVAILSEGSTQYGQASGYGKTSRKKGTCYSQPGEKSNQDKILYLKYPLHISQLRNAAEKARASENNSRPAPPTMRPPNLKLSLEEDGEPKDTIPPYSTFDTFSVELVLSNLFATIAKEGIQYIGIFSTDVRDQIFLTREIRTYAPNVTIFTLGADLIYLHSDVNLDFRGTLVISTYPLFSMNQNWTYPFTGQYYRLQFPDHTAEGVYNATLQLLNREDLELEYGMPFYQYHNKIVRERTPALWLSAVGKNDLWPVKLLDGGDSANTTTVPRVYSKTVPFILFMLSLLSGIAAAAIITDSSALGRSKCRTGRLKRWKSIMGWMLRLFGDAVYKEHRLTRRCYLLAFAVSNLIFCLIEVGVCFRFSFRLFNVRLLTVFVSVAVALVLAILSTCAIARGVLPTARWLKASGARVRSIGVLPAVILGPLLIFFFAYRNGLYILFLDPASQLFYDLRVLNLDSGLSPFLPFFFVGMGGLLWILCSLRRLRRLEEFVGPNKKNPLRFCYLGTSSTDSLDELEGKVRHFLSCPSLDLAGRWILLSLVGIPCFLIFVGFRFPRHIFLSNPMFVGGLIRSLEGPDFYRFFGWAFFLVYMALSFSFLRFFCIWLATRKLLRYLFFHPTGGAYLNLAKTYPAMIRIDLSGSFEPFTAIQFAVMRLTELFRFVERVLPNHEISTLRSQVFKTEKILEKASQSETKGNWQKAIKLRWIAKARLVKCSVTVGNALETQWRLRQTRGASVKSAKENKIEKQLNLLGQNFIAARTVAFLYHVFSHLQNLIFFVMAGLLLMLLAVNYYPFQPREWILWFNWLIILTAVGLTMLVFVQISHDSIISDLSGTTPGQVSWNRELILRIVIYGIVPILTLLGAQFPEAMSRILSSVNFLQGSP